MTQDEQYMLTAISEALAHPDGPSQITIGAVLVGKSGRVYKGHRLTRDFEYGTDLTMHAEQMALLQAGDDAAGGTLYVTLEPCACRRTDPLETCVAMILRYRVARVVVGAADKWVGSGGGDVLKTNGVQVEWLESARSDCDAIRPKTGGHP